MQILLKISTKSNTLVYAKKQKNIVCRFYKLKQNAFS